MVIPSQGLAIVSLGLTWPSSINCPIGRFDATGYDFTNGTRVPTVPLTWAWA